MIGSIHSKSKKNNQLTNTYLRTPVFELPQKIQLLVGQLAKVALPHPALAVAGRAQVFSFESFVLVAVHTVLVVRRRADHVVDQHHALRPRR